MKKHTLALVALFVCMPLTTIAQMPTMSGLKGLPGPGANSSSTSGASVSVAGDSLVRGYVAANKEILFANALLAEALGLKDAAAAARATAEALTEGATKGNLEDSNKVVSLSTEAVAAEMAKHPKLDAAAKDMYQAGMSRLGQGMLKYIALRAPAADFSNSINGVSPIMMAKLQAAVYVVSQLPAGLSNLGTSLKNANAFAKSSDIPVPADATKAMASL